MKLIDADLLREIIYRMKEKYLKKITDGDMMKYFKTEFEIYREVLDYMRACSCPTYTVIQADSGNWIPCKDKLPDVGVNVILTFRDTFHTHPSWPKVQVMPAWICNVDEDNPKGEWAIEGRLGNYVVDIDSGIAWQPLPAPYKESED